MSLAHILIARQTGFGAIVFQVFIPAKLAFKGEIERSLLIFLALFIPLPRFLCQWQGMAARE
jgi:hypothetical protein